MNNYQLRNLIDYIFGSHQRRPITKKIGLELDDRVWFKLEYPVAGQVIRPINIPIVTTIKDKND